MKFETYMESFSKLLPHQLSNAHVSAALKAHGGSDSHAIKHTSEGTNLHKGHAGYHVMWHDHDNDDWNISHAVLSSDGHKAKVENVEPVPRHIFASKTDAQKKFNSLK